MWYLDTAATHQFTYDLHNLTRRSQTYQGPNQVSIGDGSILPIQHIGLAQMALSSGNLSLTNLFHIPIPLEIYCLCVNFVFIIKSFFF